MNLQDYLPLYLLLEHNFPKDRSWPDEPWCLIKSAYYFDVQEKLYHEAKDWCRQSNHGEMVVDAIALSTHTVFEDVVLIVAFKGDANKVEHHFGSLPTFFDLKMQLIGILQNYVLDHQSSK